MKNPCITIEDCLKAHALAPPDRQRKGLAAWFEALQRDSRLSAEPEPLLNLKQVGRALNHSPSHLWRLGVQAVDEGFGGRPRYRLSRVLEYLRSPECAARREELREARRKQGKEAA